MENKSLTATLNNALTSDKKMSLIAKMVRGKDVNEAMEFLQFVPKKAARILLKAVKSAVANAENNQKMKRADLYIKAIEVGRGTRLKRMRFVGRARIHRYVKYRTNLKVILDTK